MNRTRSAKFLLPTVFVARTGSHFARKRCKLMSMKIKLVQHGGQAAGINLQRPPKVVDSAALDGSQVSELKRLVASAVSAAAPARSGQRGMKQATPSASRMTGAKPCCRSPTPRCRPNSASCWPGCSAIPTNSAATLCAGSSAPGGGRRRTTMRTRDQTLDPLDWYFALRERFQTRPSSPFAKVSAIRHSPAPRSPGRQSNRLTLMQPLARKRPVVLIVEDEVLVRIGTRETVETAGFEVVEAGNADEAIAISRPATISSHIYRHSHAGFDGRAEARSFREEPLAPGQDRRDVGPRPDRRG